MKGMIMAAGVGSRLMPLTAYVPKPMVQVGNRPLMENIVELMAQAGIDGIAANLHHHGEMIAEYFAGTAGLLPRIDFSWERELMGTAGGVKLCQDFLDDTFVVMSGDALTDIDLADLVKEHHRRGALATIALKEVADVEQYGVVVTDERGRITAFQEKPRRDEALSRLVNTGIYVFEPEIFDYIPEGQFYDFGKQVFPHLARIGAPFYGVAVDAYWCDVGSLPTYLEANYAVLAGECRYRLNGSFISRSSDGARILIGDGCEVDKAAHLLGRTVLGANCTVDRYCVIKDSVIWADTAVEKGCIIEGAVIGAGCVVGSGTIIGPGAVIASGCALPPQSRIPAGAVITRGDENGYSFVANHK